jgi:hypothetical protein
LKRLNMRVCKCQAAADRQALACRRAFLAAGAICLGLLAAGFSACTTEASLPADTAAGLEQRLRADISFLAYDQLEGR